jgi:peptidase E
MGSNCPHYDGETDRRPSYHELIGSDKIQLGIATDDGVGIHYIEQDVYKVVSSRPNAKAYKVYYDQKVIEVELETEFLGSY